MTNVKSLFASKVFWLAALQAVAGAIVVFNTAYPDLGWLILAKSAVDVFLRLITTEQVSIVGTRM